MPDSTPETQPNAKRDKTLAARRRKILEAAIGCFLENGYHQTGVRDIAKRANVSLGNLYNHFPGKHDVLVEIAQLEKDELQPFIKQLAKPGSATKVLKRFISSYAKYLAAPENVILSIEIASEAIRKPDIATLFLENRATLINALAEVLIRGYEENEFRKLRNPQEIARMFIGLIEDNAVNCMLTKVPMRKVLTDLQELVFP